MRMNRNVIKGIMAVLAGCAASILQAQTLAFPGAEGFGRFATGGRTGSVYRVTNLNDSGAGSFRDAVSKPDRIVVFDVAGVVRLQSRVAVSRNIYIAGQTAPGEGITLYGDGLSFSNAHNTICRYLRIRMGAVGTSGADALGIASGHDMIFDHCSVAWGRDEVFSISGGDAKDITIQNCIISQGLLGHSAGGLIQTDHVTIYRTLYIHNDTRNPKFKGTHQYVNNIVYNWKTAAYIMGGDSEGTSYANAESNLFITGTTGKRNAFSGANARYNIYAKDNMIDEDQNGKFNPRAISNNEFEGGPTFQSKPYDYPALPTLPANSLLTDLVPVVGASLPYRDNLDWMLICDLQSLGKEGDIISDENTLDIGAPTSWNLWKGNTNTEDRKDSDGDGMPDWWEQANNTDPQKNDAMTMRDGYTFIEHYINSITEEQSQYYLKAPTALKATDATPNSITMRWRDFTDHEEGYAIEQQMADGTFTEIAQVEKNTDLFTATGLTPQTTYKWRVRAYDGSQYSSYSNILSVSTKAETQELIDPNTYQPDVTWNGSQSNIWSTTADNWNESLYADGMKVLFDDHGNNSSIDIPDEVSPDAIMVKGEKDYSLNGIIAGKGTVNQAGTGTLKLASNNTYSGGTTIWNGTLEIEKLANAGVASSVGTAANWIWNGGTILYNGPSVSTNRETTLHRATTFNVSKSSSTVTLTGKISGDGDLIKEGEGTLSQTYGLHTYTGNTIVRGGTYELKGKDQIGNVAAINGKLILEGGRFRTTGGDNNADGYLNNFPIEVKGEKESYLDIGARTYIKNKVSGTGNLTIEVEYLREFYQGDWREFYGTVTAKQKGSQGNQFYVYNSSYNGIPNGRLVLAGNLEMRGETGKIYRIGGLSGSSTTTLACCFIKKDGGTVTWRIGGLGTDETFNGKITDGIEHNSRIGTTSIVKEGEGYWRLTGAQKYRGTTVITGGTLIQNGTHSQDKDHTNTYFTPGTYTVNKGATLAGKGSTMAPVVVKDGGYIAPGDFSIGTLTVNNDVKLEKGSILQIEVNRNVRTADKLASTGKISISGDLILTLTDGSYAAGDAVTIMSAKTYDGEFEHIIPSTPGEGLVWDTSTLYTNGILHVSANDGILPTAAQDIKVRSVKGGIVFEGIRQSEKAIIYGSNGEVVSDQSISSNTCIPAKAGIYIIKMGGKSQKVYVP